MVVNMKYRFYKDKYEWSIFRKRKKNSKIWYLIKNSDRLIKKPEPHQLTPIRKFISFSEDNKAYEARTLEEIIIKAPEIMM